MFVDVEKWKQMAKTNVFITPEAMRVWVTAPLSPKPSH